MQKPDESILKNLISGMLTPNPHIPGAGILEASRGASGGPDTSLLMKSMDGPQRGFRKERAATTLDSC